MKAWQLHQLGWSQRQIAAELGVTQGAVCQWIKRAREGGGEKGLLKRPAPGRQRSLTDEQISQIPDLLTQGAMAFGFADDQWTTARIAMVFKQVFGVAHHPSHISRILSKYYPDWRNYREP
ncbi:transposase [Phototrophicus methaneseepsis]|uniref:Transposase n=2 Tax=Phototrophicus methaneseepsis TaxID=2710758 RepID=A0A7S8E6Q6_9CHLR|nr:transposase [Phototrophicus methaneseepsis]